MASMFPTMLSYAERRLAISGQITGLFLVASAAGGMTVPWLVGQLFESTGPRVSIFLPFVSTVICLAAYMLIRLSAVLPTAPAAAPSDATMQGG